MNNFDDAVPPQRYGDNLSGNNIYNAGSFRGGGHGVINIIRHMNWVDVAVLLRDLVGHGVLNMWVQ
jgi:hypothetical protein